MSRPIHNTKLRQDNKNYTIKYIMTIILNIQEKHVIRQCIAEVSHIAQDKWQMPNKNIKF